MLRKRAVPLAAAVVAAALVSVPVAAIGGNTTALWSDSVTLATNLTITPPTVAEASIELLNTEEFCWLEQGQSHLIFDISVNARGFTHLQVSFSGITNVNNADVTVGDEKATYSGSKQLELAKMVKNGHALAALPVDFHVQQKDKPTASVTLRLTNAEGTALGPVLTIGPTGGSHCFVPDASTDDVSRTSIDLHRVAGHSPDVLAPGEPEGPSVGAPAEPDTGGPELVESESEAEMPDVEPEDGGAAIEQPSPGEHGKELDVDSSEDPAPVPAPDEPEADESVPDSSEVEGPLAIAPLPQVIEPAPAPEPEAIESDAVEPEPTSDADHEDCEHLRAEHSADECPGLLPEDEAVKPEPEEGVEPEPAPEPEPEEGIEPEPEPEPSPDEVL